MFKTSMLKAYLKDISALHPQYSVAMIPHRPHLQYSALKCKIQRGIMVMEEESGHVWYYAQYVQKDRAQKNINAAIKILIFIKHTKFSHSQWTPTPWDEILMWYYKNWSYGTFFPWSQVRQAPISSAVCKQSRTHYKIQTLTSHSNHWERSSVFALLVSLFVWTETEIEALVLSDNRLSRNTHATLSRDIKVRASSWRHSSPHHKYKLCITYFVFMQAIQPAHTVL